MCICRMYPGSGPLRPRRTFIRRVSGLSSAVAQSIVSYRDTHGMTGEFVWGFDGWVYACHGYSNESTLRSKARSSWRFW